LSTVTAPPFLTETQLFISPNLPGIAPSNLLQDSWLAGIVTDSQLSLDPIMFSLYHRESGFYLIAGSNDEAVGFARGGDTCRLLCPLEVRRTMRLSLLLISCSTTELRLEAFGDFGKLVAATKTAPTYVPLDLIRHCREQDWVKAPAYPSGHVLLQTVIESISLLEPELRANSKTLLDDTGPVPEKQLSDLIQSLLRHLEPIKNISLIREPQYSTGQLDFLATTRLEDGRPAHACIEVKRSTHPDLKHGLLVQLPEYMRRASTSFGVFLVIDFGTGHRPAAMPKDGDIARELGLLAAKFGSEHSCFIRVVVLSAEPYPAPSKMDPPTP